MDPILELFRTSLLEDTQIRNTVSGLFADALAQALKTATPDQLGDIFISVGTAIKPPVTPDLPGPL